MISFFRKIRQKFLFNSQFIKYLKYGLGEIILVMIGILLALQVNNWNNRRQLSEKESKLLLEIKNDLIGTKKELTFDLKNLEILLNVSDSIIAYLDTIQPKDYDPSIFNNKIGWVSSNVKLYPKTIAYENLKSLGVEIISNDSIRFHLTDIFDRKLLRISLWENSSIESEISLNRSVASYFKTIKSFDNYNAKDYLLIPETFTKQTKKLYINKLALLQKDRNLLFLLYKELEGKIRKTLLLLENES